MSEKSVRVLNILGRDYSIKASPAEEAALQQAAALLKIRVEESRERFPGASSHELLVLTALNLCVPLIEQNRQAIETQARLAALVQRIARRLGD